MRRRGSNSVIGAIDLGGTQVRVAVADLEGEILKSTRTRTATLGGPEGFAKWAQAELNGMLEGRRLDRVGVGAPGPCEPATGTLVNPPNLPSGWHHNLRLGAMLSARLGAPVHLENDANVAALAEHRRGAGKGARNLIYITWSTGIGAGLVLEGRLFSGSHGTAGEVGHTIVDPNGPLCACGQRGCLEALAGGAALAARIGLSAAEVFDAAANGDMEARGVVMRAEAAFGTALVDLTNLFDPDVIVIGGGIGWTAWRVVEGPLNDALRSSPFIRASRRPKLRRARLKDDVGLVGAVEWALANQNRD